ncbi:MAG TPA: hypothetical protein VHA11_09755 [Bryobacteraceae bacterium]|nr:hypothetical protein [Bryobacteraceae bacterium]
MLRGLTFGAAVLLFAALLPAATLEQLGLDEMAERSTAIVRAHVASSYTAASGPMIYTHYRVSVSERWKGPDAAELDVVVPGGAVGRQRQSFSGVPRLSSGREYVLFLWTGRSGLTHIIGLSQGIFDVVRGADGALEVTRAASGELMLDAAGRPVREQALTLHLSDLRVRVNRAIGKGATR